MDFKPHPHLTRPELHIANLPGLISDSALARALSECHPVKIEIERVPDSLGDKVGSGVIRFETLTKAENALATLPHSAALCQTFTRISSSSTHALPGPGNPAFLRVVIPYLPINSIPAPPTASFIHDLLRPFGPLRNVYVWQEAVVPSSSEGSTRGVGGWRASIEFWDENDAYQWESEWGEQLVGGWQVMIRTLPSYALSFACLPPLPSQLPDFSSLSLSPLYTSPQTLPVFSPNPFHLSPVLAHSVPVLAQTSYTTGWREPECPGQSDQRYIFGSHSCPETGSWMGKALGHGPGQHVQIARNEFMSDSGLVDFNNLYVKNIDKSIDAHQLEASFRHFGTVVSAQIIRNPVNGASRGYGFVSFRATADARTALQAMDGRRLGRQKLQVQFHSPRSLRKKLSLANMDSMTNLDPTPTLPSVASRLRGSRNQQEADTLPPDTPFEAAVADMTIEPTRSDSAEEALSDSPSLSERTLLLKAVAKFEPQRQQPLTELLMTLSPRERALCLFSSTELQLKLVGARRVLDAIDEESAKSLSVPPSATTDAAAEKAPVPSLPRSPALRGFRPAVSYGLDELAALPVATVYHIVTRPDGDSLACKLGIEPPSSTLISETAEWIAQLDGLTAVQQKQVVGERLFALLKRNGVKAAPKLTVNLLDTEDLASLSHMEQEYPALVVARAQFIATA